MATGFGSSIREGQDLRDYECPICTRYFWNSIYKCNNGHSLCGECNKKIRICPICREDLPFPRVKNKALEAVIIRKLFRCEFSTVGCNTTLKLCQMQEHKRICSFRTGRHCAPLGFPNCQIIVSLADLMSHAETAHGIPCISVDLNQGFFIEQIIPPGSAKNLKTVSWKPVFIFVKNSSKIFQLRTAFDHIDDDSKDGKIRWTIQDCSLSAANHIAMISFKKNQLQRYHETWTGAVLKSTANLGALNSWFVLQSESVIGAQSWKLKICIKSGRWGSKGSLPTCIAVNECLGAPEMSLRKEPW